MTDDIAAYGLGALPDPPDERDYPISALYASEGLTASVVLPASYAAPGMPPVLDQHATPMAALDEQEAEARDRQPAPELSAAEVVAYLRDLPRLWDDAPDSRRGLTESLFERVEVLGLRRMHLEPTPAAVAAGLVEAFSSASAGYGRGESV